MSLVTAFHISLAFVDRQLFDGIGFQIEPGDLIGLVGPNGSGKTTLLKLINGDIVPDSGEVRISKGTRIGFLPQEIQESFSGPLLKTIIETIPGRVPLRNELSRLEAALKETPDPDVQVKIAGRITEVHQELDHLGLQFPQHEAEKILLGLGFKPSDFTASFSTLSGGWKMRAVLAGLLYQKPDLLLLDEPTNHLDIPSIRWLEQFLKDFGGAMMLVSHDREFLNRHIRRVISFEPEGMKSYTGNYEFYLKSRVEEKRALEARARNQEQKIKEAQKFIDAFRAKATKARQAQSKIKLLKKMELVKKQPRMKSVKFSFPDAPRSGRVVVSFNGVSKAYGEKKLYKKIDLTILKGEKIALIGPNGCGKTTLLRIVADEISPDQGKVKLGHDVKMGYFAQHHSDMLDPRKTVIEEVYQTVPDQTIGFVRGICGAFLFSGNEVDKTIGVLSGGEKARVSLAKLLVKPGNFMVMDEPTNHLDITSSEKLIDALKGFNGTLLFVSHNQSFINQLATKIWDIRDREIVQYPGNLSEYFDHLARIETEFTPTTASSTPDESDDVKRDHPQRMRNRKAQKKERAEKRRLIYEALNPVKVELKAIETNIAELEKQEKGLEEQLADPVFFKDQAKSVPCINAYQQIHAELEALLAKWEQKQNELESLKRKFGMISNNGKVADET